MKTDVERNGNHEGYYCISMDSNFGFDLEVYQAYFSNCFKTLCQFIKRLDVFKRF